MSKPLYTSAEIATATGGTASCEFSVTGISNDTRTLQKGDLYVAIAGENFDGHKFCEAAMQAGAAGCLVSTYIAGEIPHIRVDDTLIALEALAAHARDRATNCQRVAITGSVGKTSTKEMIAKIFAAAGKAHWPEQSFNNQIGTALTLARMPADTERAIFEVGMNSVGEIAQRVALIQPHIAGITNIAPCHLEGLQTLEGIAEEKANIYSNLPTSGYALVPIDDKFYDFFCDKLNANSRPHYSFGVKEAADSRFLGKQGNLYRFSVLGERIDVKMNTSAPHWGVNASLALLVAKLTNVPLTTAAEALLDFGAPAGRGEISILPVPNGEGTYQLIDDAYNANPASMGAALRGLGALDASRKLCALGDMLELGLQEAQYHTNLAADVIAADADAVFTCGDLMLNLHNALPNDMKKYHFPRVDQPMLDAIRAELKDGDALLCKSSKGSNVRHLVTALKNKENYST